MSTVVVAADNVRIDTMDTTTNVQNIGGGAAAGAEPDVFYQGTGSVSRKVSTAQRGFWTSGGSTFDLTATRRTTVMLKAAIVNWNALDPQTTPGLQLLVGSGATATDYYEFDISLPDIYPPRGGFIIRPIDANVSGYRDGTVGTPDLTGARLFGIQGDFSVTSKSENVVLDAVDHGAGLNLTNGDGASADGVFEDFVAHDEGTIGNRYGYVTTTDGIIYVYGKLWIGQNTSQASIITEFTDSSRVLVFPEGLFDAGFSGIGIDLGNASTTVSITNCVFNSRGNTTTADTRAIFDVTGTSGTAIISACSFDTFASFTLNSAVTFTDCIVTNSEAIDAGSGADLSGTTISGSTVAVNTSAVIWDVNLDPNGELDNMSITKGTNAHHAIEFGLTSPLTMTLTGIDFSGFNAANANDDSTFHIKRTTGTVTINIIGGSGNVSFRTDGATVVIVQNPVSLTLNVIDNSTEAAISGARAFVLAAATGPLPFQDSVTITRVTTTASVAHTAHGLDNGQKVLIEGAEQDEYNGIQTISNVSANAYDYTVSGSPTTPATGTIISTAVIISGTTNGSGVISDTRTYGSDQDFTGRVRDSTDPSPFYKTQPITGTIDKDNGTTVNIRLVRDE